MIPVKIDRDKIARVHAVSPLVEAGKVFVPESARWVDEWIEKHVAFPHGEHDDQVNTTSMALARLAGSQENSWDAIAQVFDVAAFFSR